MSRALTFVLLLCLTSQAFAKTFSECELFRELKRQGFPDHELNDWMCLINAESSRQTHVVGGSNADGSHDYGLFQINDRYWCSNNDKPGKECNIRCKDLLLDDITIASQCTKKIFSVHGFSAWVTWRNKCQGRAPHVHC